MSAPWSYCAAASSSPSDGSANALGSVPAYADDHAARRAHVVHAGLVARLELADQRDLHAADEADDLASASSSPAIAPTTKLPSCSRNRRPARFGSVPTPGDGE